MKCLLLFTVILFQGALAASAEPPVHWVAGQHLKGNLGKTATAQGHAQMGFSKDLGFNQSKKSIVWDPKTKRADCLKFAKRANAEWWGKNAYRKKKASDESKGPKIKVTGKVIKVSKVAKHSPYAQHPPGEHRSHCIRVESIEFLGM